MRHFADAVEDVQDGATMSWDSDQGHVELLRCYTSRRPKSDLFKRQMRLARRRRGMAIWQLRAGAQGDTLPSRLRRTVTGKSDRAAVRIGCDGVGRSRRKGRG